MHHLKYWNTRITKHKDNICFANVANIQSLFTLGIKEDLARADVITGSSWKIPGQGDKGFTKNLGVSEIFADKQQGRQKEDDRTQNQMPLGSSVFIAGLWDILVLVLSPHHFLHWEDVARDRSHWSIGSLTRTLYQMNLLLESNRHFSFLGKQTSLKYKNQHVCTFQFM